MIDLEELVAGLLRRAGVEFERLSLIVLNRSPSGATALAVLVFVDDEALPFAAVKIGTDPVSALQAEYENLQLLHERGSTAFARTVPRALRLERRGDLVLLAETAIRGTRLKDFPPDRYFRSERFERHLAAVVEWLVEFHRACGNERVEIAKEVLDPAAAIEAYRRHHHPSAALDELLSEALAVLCGRPPVVAPPWHGDFNTANVVACADGSIAVLDWEFPLRRAWPLADLLFFAASVWCIPYAKGQAARIENYRSLFFGSHPLSRTLGRAVAGYLERIGVDQELMLPLSVLAWVSYANRKREAYGSAPSDGGPEHEPLILFAEGRCLNLELLAAERASYVLTRPVALR